MSCFSMDSPQFPELQDSKESQTHVAKNDPQNSSVDQVAATLWSQGYEHE